MKKLSFFIVLVVLSFNVSFANNPITDPTSQVVLEIKKLLESPKFNFENQDQEAKAMVTFTLNNKNEIVIIDVESENIHIGFFVKERLNYHRLNNQSLLKGKVYKMPLKIVNN